MIPVFDITRQNKILKRELSLVFSDVIQKGVFILGKHVSDFETAFAKYIGSFYAVGVASGTDALSLALLALGIKPGDEVVVPANSYPTAFAITAIGAVAKLVDIGKETFNIDPKMLSSAITKKTKAIIVVHLYGQPADMQAIIKISKEFNIPVVEDCAQAHGAEVKVQKSLKEKTEWKKVGSLGDVGCFSFYPTKNLGCFGDGGMVVTNNPDIYKKVKLLRMYGEESRYNSILIGRNSRLDEIQAAVLLVKLKYLDKWNERRREIAELYHLLTPPPGRSPSATFQVSLRPTIILPYEAPYVRHVYHLYVIRVKKRDELKSYLDKIGIKTAIHYPVPIHFVPSMKYLVDQKGDFPESETACNEILSLPMFPELTDDEVQQVAEKTIKFLK